MALTNTQYQLIMQEYDRLQNDRHALILARTQELYQICPDLQKLDQEYVHQNIAAAKSRLLEDSAVTPPSSVRYRKLREAYITECGYPKNYLDPDYICPDCKDTGYIGTQRCHCFIQRSLDLCYQQSRLFSVLQEENFDRFCLDYYEDNREIYGEYTPRKLAEHAYLSCKHFCNTFEESFQNILLYGQPGLGKSYLTHCIARQILDQNHSVIYFTANELMDILLKLSAFDAEDIDQKLDILNVDLLIIDDLGTEQINKLTIPRIFNIINERLLTKRSTVISTNLSLDQIQELYSERVTSRLIESYTILKLIGEDIRIKKQLS